jgi:membrane-associated phospholipid phosphatase
MKPRSINRVSLSSLDLISLVYCAWILLYLGLGMLVGRAVEPYEHTLYFSMIAGFILLLAYGQAQLDPSGGSKLYRLLSFVRGIYPVAFFGFFFTSLYSVNRILFPQWIDPFFYEIDRSIFGYLPSMEWGVKYDAWWISELFHFAYFCYYPMIAGLPLYFYFKNKKAFGEIIFTLSFVFYLCYFLFSLLPVIGGRYFPEAMELTKLYRGGPFTHIMAYIYNVSKHLGGAFPSSHVAIATVLTVSALRHLRKLGYVFVVISFFLALATVYCHYHWFIDMVMGLFTGVGGYYLALWVHSSMQKKGIPGAAL